MASTEVSPMATDHEVPWEGLAHDLLLRVLSNLTASELGRSACVCRSWRDAAGSDSLWKGHLAADFGEQERVGPGGGQEAATSSYREAYARFHASFGKPEYKPYYLRLKTAIERIEGWMVSNDAPSAGCLQCGATEAEIDEAARRLQTTAAWHPAVRLLYRLRNGQEGSKGFLGGYSFYDTYVNMSFLGLASVQRLTRTIAELIDLPSLNHVLFALAIARNTISKALLINVSTGELCVVRNRGTGAVPCWPGALAQPLGSGSHPQRPDGLVRWFEQYAADLEGGVLRVEELIPSQPMSRGISLYPHAGPRYSCCVTRGVKVEAGALYIPEDSEDAQFFSYSITYSLLSEAEQRAQWPEGAGPCRVVERVQLRSRHWVITDARGHVEEVRGDAVIGQFPILTAGGPPFSYRSCTHMVEVPGTMRGDFAFVEGTLQSPTGPEFLAICAPFELSVPEYVY